MDGLAVIDEDKLDVLVDESNGRRHTRSHRIQPVTYYFSFFFEQAAKPTR
jgi:hypothetical protein